MTEQLFSSSWYRVAKLKPRLRSHARIHNHQYRGQRWYVLEDKSSGQHMRFTEIAQYVISLMNGNRTVNEIWEMAATHLGDDSPTQDELIQLLTKLHATDVLQCNITPDTEELFRRHERSERTRFWRQFASPLSLRFPLLDPERFLERWVSFVKPFFCWLGLLFWLGVVLVGIVLAGMHWSELTHNVSDRVMTAHNLLILWLLYPIVKALHELGHAFATKVWGGEVHEMGIMMLVLVPIPYVDASSSSVFRNKYQRIIVGAAGMMVELFLASLAMFVWLNVESGIVSTIAYNVMLIGAVSTVLFNGNPLLRFDGYFILADAIEVPNLATRSKEYIAYLVQKYLFGLQSARASVLTLGERLWFIFYGVCSFVYRMFIMFVIVLFISGKFFFIGLMLAAWMVITQILVPIYKMVIFVLIGEKIHRHRIRAIALSALLLVSMYISAYLIPLPLGTYTEGVVWLPEKSQVRAGTDCSVGSIMVESNAMVVTDQPLIKCEDPLLNVNVKTLEAEQNILKLRLSSEGLADRVKAKIIRDDIEEVSAKLKHANERLAELVIRSPNTGHFIIPTQQDLYGRYVNQGDLIGYVVDLTKVTVSTVVPQSDIDLVRNKTLKVELRSVDSVRQVIPAELTRQVPAAISRLPSKILGTAAGGKIIIDSNDTDGLRPLQKVFQVDLTVKGAKLTKLGSRVYVRFDHGSEPVGYRWYRSFRRLFLRKIDV